MASQTRPGEIAATLDPAAMPGNAHLVFIGCATTPWLRREDCPKNMREARERGATAAIRIDEPWRAGLLGLKPGDPVIVLTWLDRARRDLVVQSPRHRAEPTGTFVLRSPVRPNPIGLHVVRLLEIDDVSGTLLVDALDCLDGTPVLDLKPWLPGADVPPGSAD